MDYSYDYFKVSADYVKSIVPWEPDIAIILGSGLSPLAQIIENPIVIDYADIPNFLLTTVKSHPGKLIFGTVSGKKIVCMAGRFHTYEGYDFEQLVIPVRLFKLLGAKALIMTCAVGAVNPSYAPGDITIITDHIKLNGPSPLRGRNIDEFGPRFFDTSRMYTPELRKLAVSCGSRSRLTLHEGVYMFFTGPQFETPAEIRAAGILGADVIGMSTVPEAITAAHCGLPLLVLSVVTNMAAGVVSNRSPVSEDKTESCSQVTIEEVDTVSEMISDSFTKYVVDIIAHLNV